MDPCFIMLGWRETTLKYVEQLVKNCSRGAVLKYQPQCHLPVSASCRRSRSEPFQVGEGMKAPGLKLGRTTVTSP